MNKVQVVYAAAVAAKVKAEPLFNKSEHAAAISYAVTEIFHFHDLVVFASAVLLISFALIMFGRGLEMLLSAIGNSIAAM